MARRVGTPQQSARDGGMGIPAVVAPFVVSTVLPQDLDLAGIIGHDDDVPVRMAGARKVRWGFLGQSADARGAIARLLVFARGLGLAGQRDRGRVADVVDRILREAKGLLDFGRRHHGGRHHRRLRFKHLHGTFVGRRFLRRSGWPQVGTAILTSADDMLSVVAERGANLAAGIFVAAEFGLEGAVAEVVEADARIVAGDEQLHFAVGIAAGNAHRIDARDFTALGIAAARRADVDLRDRLEAVGLVDVAHAVEAAGDRMPPVGGKGNRGDHVRRRSDKGHALVGDAP